MISLLGINSIQALQIIALVEIELNIEFEDDKIEPAIVISLKEFIEEIRKVIDIQ